MTHTLSTALLSAAQKGLTGTAGSGASSILSASSSPCSKPGSCGTSSSEQMSGLVFSSPTETGFTSTDAFVTLASQGGGADAFPVGQSYAFQAFAKLQKLPCIFLGGHVSNSCGFDLIGAQSNRPRIIIFKF